MVIENRTRKADQASDANETGEPRRTEPAVGYRPHLDGLRAVAVYLVVLFHAGSRRFPGGYIGVDVFFVLSGFLVTRLLLADIVGGGAIRFSRFYSRRFRRLLPAAFVTLIVTGVVYTAIASPVEVAQAVGSFKAAFLYSTNWYFIHQQTQYFGGDISTNPVLHFWSLAVEEQFYLVWPLALGGVFALTRRMHTPRRLRTIQLAVAFGALASAIWALSIRSSDPTRAYYGTDARAYELLAGAFIALVPNLVDTARPFRRSLRAATVLSLLAIIALASSLVDSDAITRGITVTMATCVLIVALEATDGGLAKRALSTRSMVYLGKVSYGTYLWHWLVILVVFEAFHISTIATIGIACLVATALAALSFELLEKPVRLSELLDRHRLAVVAAGLVVSVVSALVLIPRIVDPVHATAPVLRDSRSADLTPVPASLDLEHTHGVMAYPSCLGKRASACTLVGGSGPRVLLIGDSHASMLIPLFTEIAHLENMRLSASVLLGCPWQRNLTTSYFHKRCQRQKEDLYTRVIPALKPDIIVVANLDYGTSGPYPAIIEARGQSRDAGDATVAAATTSALETLRSVAPDVIIVEPIPLPRVPRDNFNPLACLQKTAVLERCRYVARARPSALESLYRSLARRDRHVHSLNLDRAICPFFPSCDPVVNGQVVKWDPSHLTPTFARTLAPTVDVYLRRAGLLPR